MKITSRSSRKVLFSAKVIFFLFKNVDFCYKGRKFKWVRGLIDSVRKFNEQDKLLATSSPTKSAYNKTSLNLIAIVVGMVVLRGTGLWRL